MINFDQKQYLEQNSIITINEELLITEETVKYLRITF